MKRVLILGIFIFFSLLPLPGQDLSDYYARLYRFFDYFSSRNTNTGVTAFPILFIPPGGKYEGMGTAYSAVAGDSGFLESNPSASAVLEYTELSFLHNNWIADSKVEGAIFTTRFKNLGIGFGGKFLYLPFTEYDDWATPLAGSYYSESLGTLNISHNFFSNYYFYGLAAGANLKFAYRYISDIHIPSDMASQKAFTALMDLGILTRFNFLKFYAAREKNFALGLVVKNLGFPALDDPLPAYATLGFAYSPVRPLLIALDFNLPFSLDPEKEAETWNISTGFDLSFTDFFSLQGGFSYWGSNPRISLGSTVILREVTFTINYSLDMTTQFEAFNRISLEAKLNLGDKGRFSLRMRVDELYIAGLEAYANGNLEEAIRFWEAAIKLDPSFNPAQENLQTVKKALELMNQMEAIQTTE